MATAPVEPRSANIIHRAGGFVAALNIAARRSGPARPANNSLFSMRQSVSPPGLRPECSKSRHKAASGNAYLAGRDAQTVKFLQNIAWDTVQEYYGK
jgi:hypothetical protein